MLKHLLPVRMVVRDLMADALYSVAADKSVESKVTRRYIHVSVLCMSYLVPSAVRQGRSVAKTYLPFLQPYHYPSVLDKPRWFRISNRSRRFLPLRVDVCATANGAHVPLRPGD
jgi:hypothetical protein